MKSHSGKQRQKNYIQVLVRVLGKKSRSIKSKSIHVESTDFDRVLAAVEKAIKEEPE